MIGTDEWRWSDDAFALFVATVDEDDFSKWEARAYWMAVNARRERDRVARYEALKRVS